MADINELKDKFDNGHAQGRLDAIAELLELGGINKEEADSFVDANSGIVGTEFRILGFSLDNPLLRFLQQYNTSKKNIKPFLIPENWMCIHNLYANNVLDEKQLDFSCSDIDKPLLLLYDNFWTKTQDVDKQWYVQTWEWCSTDSPNSQILNDYVRLLFSNVNITDVQKQEGNVIEKIYSWEEVMKNIEQKVANIEFNSPENCLLLRKCLLFSNILLEYEENVKKIMSQQTTLYGKIDTFNQIKQKNPQADGVEDMNKNIETEVRNFSNAFISLISDFKDKLSPDNYHPSSAPLLPTATTNKIIMFLNRDVNLSNRDVLGRWREQQGHDNQSTKKNRNNNTSSKNNTKVPYMNQQEVRDVFNKAGIDVKTLKNYINSSATIQGGVDRVVNALKNMNLGDTF